MILQRAEFVSDITHFPNKTDAHERRIEALEKWTCVTERLLDAHATHQEALAKQMAEITLCFDVLKSEFPEMMAKGVSKALTDPTTWETMGEELQRTAGPWFVRGLRVIFGRLMWLLCLYLSIKYVDELKSFATFIFKK